MFQKLLLFFPAQACYFFNGFYLGNNQSGYVGAAYDITDYINYNRNNVLVVRVDATQYEGWFYEGAGIYRHVWLNRHNNLHIAHHTKPRLPWYELPAYYRSERDVLVARNHGYRMNGYGEIFRRYFFRPKEPVAHPLIK